MKVMTGSKPVGVLLDEVHIMSTYSYASRVIGQIRGGLIANPESFLIMITTQSDEPPAGVFKAELQYARGVRDGRIANAVRLLPVLYEFPEAMQVDPAKPWADPRNWPMVLPNLGRSISLDRWSRTTPPPRRRARRRSGAGRRSTSTSRSAWPCTPPAGAAPTTGSRPPTRTLTLDALLDQEALRSGGGRRRRRRPRRPLRPASSAA
jgi:hypothetical protein